MKDPSLLSLSALLLILGSSRTFVEQVMVIERLVD